MSTPLPFLLFSIINQCRTWDILVRSKLSSSRVLQVKAPLSTQVNFALAQEYQALPSLQSHHPFMTDLEYNDDAILPHQGVEPYSPQQVVPEISDSWIPVAGPANEYAIHGESRRRMPDRMCIPLTRGGTR